MALPPAQQQEVLAQLAAQQAQHGQYVLPPPSKIGTILKNFALFGGLGAALGFGASFFTLPIIGQVGAPIAAAVGGGIGALIGLVKGISSANKQQAAYDAAVQPAQPPVYSTAEPVAEPVAPNTVAATYSAQSKPRANKRSYTIKHGDTLSAIGRRYGISWERIYKANRAKIGSNPNLIYPGTVLTIPTR